MIPTEVMTRLATLGLRPGEARAVAEMLSAVEGATKVEAAAEIEARRANDRERKHRQRHGTSRDVTGQDGTSGTTPALDKEIPPTPPKEIKPSPISPVVGSARELFSEFWALFPNKVGKGDAFRKFVLALQRASFEEIMAGLRRYVAKTDDRPWCNPATFLNQDRWGDEPAETVPRAASPPRQQSFIDVQRELEREGFFTDEQASIGSDFDNAQRLPPDRRDGQAGAVVDLRPNLERRFGSGNR